MSESRQRFMARQQQNREVRQVFYTVRQYRRALEHRERHDDTRDIVALITMIVFLVLLIVLAR